MRKFLADPSPGKRDALIDALIARPEFADYWTYKWSDVLMLSGTRLRPLSLKAYYNWVRGNVAAGTPWDQFVRAIITATGDSLENGATNFYALSQSPEEMTENACQAFLGLSIGCAKCHNHPLEKWTNDQYYAMANMFARVKAKGWGGEARQGDGQRTLYVTDSGDLIQPRTGKPQPPTPLDGRPLALDDPADRRASLARVADRARESLLRPVDHQPGLGQLFRRRTGGEGRRRAGLEPGEQRSLAAGGGRLPGRGQKFDLRALMKAILQSNAYGRSSRPLAGNHLEHRFYSRYYPRRMMAEVLHDAIVQVTQVPTRVRLDPDARRRPPEDRLLSAGDAGRSALRLGRRELLPPGLRPQPAADRLRMRTLRRADNRAGHAHLERDHTER